MNKSVIGLAGVLGLYSAACGVGVSPPGLSDLVAKAAQSSIELADGPFTEAQTGALDDADASLQLALEVLVGGEHGPPVEVQLADFRRLWETLRPRLLADADQAVLELDDDAGFSDIATFGAVGLVTARLGTLQADVYRTLPRRTHAQIRALARDVVEALRGIPDLASARVSGHIRFSPHRAETSTGALARAALVAHELTHVVQQRSGAKPSPAVAAPFIPGGSVVSAALDLAEQLDTSSLARDTGATVAKIDALLAGNEDRATVVAAARDTLAAAARMFQALSNASKAKHDAAMAAIQNTR